MVCWGHKETDIVSNNSQTGCGVQSMLNSYEGTKKISPSTLQHQQQPEPLIQPKTDPCFHVVTPNSHLTGTAEIATRETSQRFSNLLLSSFVENLWISAWLSCSGLTGVAPCVASCCCRPSSLRFWNALLHSLVVTSVAFLSSVTSLSILLSPLTSTRHFHPHNCCSLNIYSLLDPSL